MLFCRVAVAPYPAHRCVIRRSGKRSATRQLNHVRANAIRVENVHKTFVLHQQHGVRLPVLADASLTVNVGECVVLHGHSGSGKSTLLRSLYANYLPDSGHIHIPPRRRMGGHGHRHPTQGAGSAQNHHRLGPASFYR